MSDKMKEATAHFNAGVKYETNKSFFGASKPDYDSAAVEFEQAAIAFKNLSYPTQCIEAYARASSAHKQLGSYFMSGKAMENAALIALQGLKDYNGASRYYQQASDMFCAHGSPDKGAECLEKAAKTLESTNLDKAAQLYLAACDVFDSEDRTLTGIESFKRTLFFFIKNARWQNAIDVSERLLKIYLKHENRHQFHRQALSTVILVLASGDEIDASKRMDAQPSFMASEECKIAGRLIEMYEARDIQGFEAVQGMQVIRMLDNEVARVAVGLKVPGTQSAVQAMVDEEDGIC